MCSSREKLFYPRTPFRKYSDVGSQVFRRNQQIAKEFFEWLCRPPKCTTYRVNLLEAEVDAVKTQIQNELLKKYMHSPAIHTTPEIPELISVSSFEKTENETIAPNNKLNEIVVDKSCGASILRGAHVYAPGVMAMRSGTRVGDLANVYADIEGKCRKGTNVVYESAFKTFLGTGRIQMARYQLFGEKPCSRGIAVEMIETISGVPSIGDLSSSAALLQNLPSIICCHVLDPQPGEIVLDMCSAPGNKTTHLAELMKDTGCIIALDKTQSKIELVKQKILERNLKSVKCFAFDSSKALADNISSPNVRHGPPFERESFDRILLDAPCSALGNRPLLDCDLSAKMLQSYPKIQKKLFTSAVGLLKKQGVLVYSTCTVTEDENEGMVRWALDTFPELKLLKANPIFGSSGLGNGLLTDNERCLVQRFGPACPDDEFDSVGFFIAKFCKMQ